MTAKHSEYIIRQPKQLAALGSAARQELVDTLAGMGTVSVAELATALGRPADALYFHLRALQKAGLVRRAGYRTRGGRQEALFRTAASELRLQYRPRDAANRAGVTRIVGSMLRLGTRDFTRAMLREDVAVSGAQRELWALRKAGRLSPGQLRRMNQAIRGLALSLSHSKGRGRLYALTILLTPLDRGRNSAAKKKGTR
jgi:DNA-binding transcriptional ArsR family regulator